MNDASLRCLSCPRDLRKQGMGVDAKDLRYRTPREMHLPPTLRVQHVHSTRNHHGHDDSDRETSISEWQMLCSVAHVRAGIMIDKHETCAHSAADMLH